ncbi:MAG: PD-(D/E)XK nuclease family protein [Proteobacteria bacterium]|nr:PD-(D/E)XK nuclease family protein [Pseudomonadota bacterium]
MTRIFLGWEKPILELAADALAAQASAPGVSLQHVVVVVPGQRAGRNLLARLTTHAEERGTALIPPTLLTAGRLPELLYEGTSPLLSELEAELLWISILRDHPTLVARLLSGAAAPQGFSKLHGLAKMLMQLRSELGVLGESIPALISQKVREYVVTAERWEALAELMHQFEAELASRNQSDIHQARAAALAQGRFVKTHPIILLGTLDLPVVAKRMLRASDAQFEAWIHAPSELEKGFDEFGAVLPEFWREHAIQIAEEQIAVVPGAPDQARCVVRQIAKWADTKSKPGADDIVVSLPDPSVTSHVKEALTEYALPVRDSSGVVLSYSGPGSVLSLAAAFLSTGTIQDLGSLVRHPDLLQWLMSRPAVVEVGSEIISLLDRYQTEVLPLTLFAPEGTALSLSGAGKPRAALEAVLATLAELGVVPSAEARTPPQWVPIIRSVLRELYGARRLRRGLNEEKVELESLEILDSELTAIDRLPHDYGVSISLGEMLGFVLQRVGTHSIEPNTFEAAIELVGWLELYFDERPFVVVAGCNEGFLPETITADPFLPDTTRKQLGLSHNGTRYARDCAVLAAVLHSRVAVQFVMGSRGPKGEVNAPSQLLLSDPATRATRVLSLYNAGKHESPAGADLEIARTPQLLLPREPQSAKGCIDTVAVTGLSRYRDCPYRFYLQEVEKLSEVRDYAQELDGRAFGILGHEVLCSITPGSELATLQDPKVLCEVLDRRLSELVQRRFGSNVVPAVQLQIAALRTRIAEFAKWQALWAAQGWRVRYVEHSLGGQIETPRGVLAISAKLDRIDEHFETGQLAVFDYKFQDTASSANEMHRGAKEIYDLQLPLYRMVLKQNGFPAVKLAILSLSGEAHKPVAPSWLELGEAEFEEAEAAAREAASGILEGVFWPPSTESFQGDPLKWICGVGVSDPADDESEEGADE